jgi:hypothetical protein
VPAVLRLSAGTRVSPETTTNAETIDAVMTRVGTIASDVAALRRTVDAEQVARPSRSSWRTKGR